jgi:hypothetical protein
MPARRNSACTRTPGPCRLRRRSGGKRTPHTPLPRFHTRRWPCLARTCCRCNNPSRTTARRRRSRRRRNAGRSRTSRSGTFRRSGRSLHRRRPYSRGRRGPHRHPSRRQRRPPRHRVPRRRLRLRRLQPRSCPPLRPHLESRLAGLDRCSYLRWPRPARPVRLPGSSRLRHRERRRRRTPRRRA